MTEENILEKDFSDIMENLGEKNIKNFKNKNILITGADGFIGNFLVRFFLYLNNQLNYKINILMMVGPRYIPNFKISKILKRNKVKVIKKDLTEKIKIKEKIDYVFHLASITSPAFISDNPVQSLKINILGTLNILEAFRIKKIKKFIYFSSSAIYGIPDRENIPIPETFNGNVSSVLSRSSYAEAKRASESLSQAYFFQYKMPINILRPFHIFGPTMDLNKENAINYFLKCGLENKGIILSSNGQETRSFCYITDAISIVLFATLINKSGEVFNIGNEKVEIKIIDLAKLVSRIFNNGIDIKTDLSRKGNFSKEKLTRNVPNMRKVKILLNFSPKVDLQNGLLRIAKSYEKK